MDHDSFRILDIPIYSLHILGEGREYWRTELELVLVEFCIYLRFSKIFETFSYIKFDLFSFYFYFIGDQIVSHFFYYIGIKIGSGICFSFWGVMY